MFRTSLAGLTAAALITASLTSGSQPARAAGCTISTSGDIGAQWTALGGQAGPLGCPSAAVSSIMGAYDYQTFEHGSIATQPKLGAHMTLAAYVDMFRELHVVWSNATPGLATFAIGTRANPVSYQAPFTYRDVPAAPSGAATFAMGSTEDSELVACPRLNLRPGAPCTSADGTVAGVLTETIAMAPAPPPPPAPTAAPLPSELDFAYPSITFSGSTPVNGNAYLTLYQNGNVAYKGHTHDSGVPSYSTEMVCGVVSADGVAFVAPHSGHIDGTEAGFSPNRDDDWSSATTNAAVTNDWPELVKSHQASCKLTVDTDVNEAVKDVVGYLSTIAQVVETVEKVVELFS